jgi:hypothetical protein
MPNLQVIARVIARDMRGHPFVIGKNFRSALGHPHCDPRRPNMDGTKTKVAALIRQIWLQYGEKHRRLNPLLGRMVFQLSVWRAGIPRIR